MGVEIERKFLVEGDSWRQNAVGKKYCQGYMYTPKGVVRVRIAGDEAFLTIKGARNNLSRSEFEYNIPMEDAKSLLEELCEQPFIDKTRYVLEENGVEWVVDEFHGENTGLILAEVELESADDTVFLPKWAGQDVSDDSRFYNSNLVKFPYSKW